MTIGPPIYVNVGAVDIKGQRIRTKSALRRAVEDTPHSVFFDQTSQVHDGSLPGIIEIKDFIEANNRVRTELHVVGPDPYHNRNWYASIILNSKGAVRVK